MKAMLFIGMGDKKVDTASLRYSRSCVHVVFVGKNQQDLNIELNSAAHQRGRCTSKQDIMQTTDGSVRVCVPVCVRARAEICHITFIPSEIAHHDSASSPQLNVSSVITSNTHTQTETRTHTRTHTCSE